MNDNPIYSSEELKAIQNIELLALKELLRVSEIIDVNPFLIGGSALGAVRHNGFIPWDDDIDVGMVREDYDKFIQQARTHLDKKYYLQAPELSVLSKGGDRCPYPYAKLRVNGTSFVEYCNRNVDMHHGVYVDIFPFDEVPDNDAKNLKQFRKVRALKMLYIYRENPDISQPPVAFKDQIKQVLRYAMYCVCHLIPRKRILNLITENSSAYKGANTAAIACLDYPIRYREYALKNEIFPLQKHAFESIVVDIPRNYDIYLTHHYGNWRKLPPENKRYGHKPWCIDTGL